jgi:hypothetical protein
MGVKFSNGDESKLSANPIPLVYQQGNIPLPTMDQEEGEVAFPVIFSYPEHAQSDFIGEFRLGDSFRDHLNEMLVIEWAPWDEQGKYSDLDNIVISFDSWIDAESRDEKKSVSVNLDMTLLEALSLGYEIFDFCPVFRISRKDQ